MSHTSDFLQRQPGYLQSILNPATLRGYAPKNKSIPLWLDYCLYGPPSIRDSDPTTSAWCWLFAILFGRTEHDTEWNGKGWKVLRGSPKKGPLLRGFNGLCLVFMYILFMYLPFHRIYWDGMKPHWRQASGAAPDLGAEVVCKSRFPLANCQPGCEREGLFQCKPKLQ